MTKSKKIFAFVLIIMYNGYVDFSVEPKGC